jgi:hypothetical protein
MKFSHPDCRLFLPVFLLAACGSSGATMGTAGPGPIAPTDQVLTASATAPTEEAAFALARKRLLAALLADESLLAENPLNDQLASVIHLQASDPLRFSKVDGGVQVDLGLTRDSLRAAFIRLDTALGQAPEPKSANALAPAVHALRLASLRRASCLRQKQLGNDVPCEPVDTTAQTRQLEQVLASVRLRPVYAGGIPMKDQVWLRPLAVVATLANGETEQPLPELPLRVQSSGSSSAAARTDASGIATLPIAPNTPATTTWTVTLDLDLDGLVGPGVKLTPVCSTTLQGRPTGLTRSTLVHAAGKTPALQTGRALLEAMKDQVTQPVALAEAESRQLTDLVSIKAKAPGLADHRHGTLDTILLLDAESEFASRMGSDRVWYEARGTLRVCNAWTGETVAEVSATVTEADFGEERAESAARESLGRDLAGRLRQKLGIKPANP